MGRGPSSAGRGGGERRGRRRGDAAGLVAREEADGGLEQGEGEGELAQGHGWWCRGGRGGRGWRARGGPRRGRARRGARRRRTGGAGAPGAGRATGRGRRAARRRRSTRGRARRRRWRRCLGGISMASGGGAEREGVEIGWGRWRGCGGPGARAARPSGGVEARGGPATSARGRRRRAAGRSPRWGVMACRAARATRRARASRSGALGAARRRPAPASAASSGVVVVDGGLEDGGRRGSLGSRAAAWARGPRRRPGVAEDQGEVQLAARSGTGISAWPRTRRRRTGWRMRSVSRSPAQNAAVSSGVKRAQAHEEVRGRERLGAVGIGPLARGGPCHRRTEVDEPAQRRRRRHVHPVTICWVMTSWPRFHKRVDA
jgi:hypothetical protein